MRASRGVGGVWTGWVAYSAKAQLTLAGAVSPSRVCKAPMSKHQGVEKRRHGSLKSPSGHSMALVIVPSCPSAATPVLLRVTHPHPLSSPAWLGVASQERLSRVQWPPCGPSGPLWAALHARPHKLAAHESGAYWWTNTSTGGSQGLASSA